MFGAVVKPVRSIALVFDFEAFMKDGRRFLAIVYPLAAVLDQVTHSNHLISIPVLHPLSLSIPKKTRAIELGSLLIRQRLSNGISFLERNGEIRFDDEMRSMQPIAHDLTWMSYLSEQGLCVSHRKLGFANYPLRDDLPSILDGSHHSSRNSSRSFALFNGKPSEDFDRNRQDLRIVVQAPRV